ncbi:MAG: prepilin-type N-terminal cleavage/methylation domain-containing protein [Candidatus Paceibacterota bacterium]
MSKSQQDLKTKIDLVRGFSLIEIIIASSVILIVWIVVFYTFSVLTQFSSRSNSSIKASMILEEGGEALRSLKDSSWTNNIAPSSTCTDSYPCRLSYNTISNLWTSTTSLIMIDNKFDRIFFLSAVNRDSNFNVVTSGGTIDQNSKKATVIVSWYQGNATTSQSLETYLFNDLNN